MSFILISEVLVTFPPLYRKMLALGFLTLVLLWPQAWIEDLVVERDGRHRTATDQILREWGDTLEVRGPLLRVPVRAADVGAGWQVDGAVHAIARDLSVTGTIDVESRSRGIFSAQVYQGTLTISGTVDAPGVREGKALVWSEASLLMFYSDRSGASGPALLTSGPGGAPVPMSMGYVADMGGTHVGARFGTASPPATGEPLKFSVTVPFKGVRSFRFTPLAFNSTTILTSNWASPGFIGNWLPIRRELRADGFQAEFNGTSSLSDFNALGLENPLLTPMSSGIDGFIIELRDDVSHYLQVTRAVKYAALFVVLTFVTFFLFETFGGLKLHPIQYTAVGCAQIVFYLLLLSFSERVSFGVAYAIAAVAVVVLITGYSRSILRAKGRTFIIGIGLTGLYGFMYTLLQLEQQSLIVGSIGVFCALATFMYATRNVDWYRLGKVDTV